MDQSHPALLAGNHAPVLFPDNDRFACHRLGVRTKAFARWTVRIVVLHIHGFVTFAQDLHYLVIGCSCHMGRTLCDLADIWVAVEEGLKAACDKVEDAMYTSDFCEKPAYPTGRLVRAWEALSQDSPMARTAGRALRSCTRLVKGPGYSERYGLQPKQSPVLLR